MFYDLNQLPPPGLTAEAQLVWQAESKWKDAARVLGAIRSAPITLGWQLRQHLDNLVQYVAQAQNEIRVFYERGGSGMEPVGRIEGLAYVGQHFLAALPAAQAQWNEFKRQAGDSVSGFSGFGAYGDVSAQTAQTFLELTKPPSDTQYVVGVLVAVGLFALVTALR